MEYPNSGVLWTSTQKRNDRAPDMHGDITIEKDLLLSMINEARGEASIKIKLDGWKKKDRNDNPMVSIKVNTFKPTRQAQSSAKDPWDD